MPKHKPYSELMEICSAAIEAVNARIVKLVAKKARLEQIRDRHSVCLFNQMAKDKEKQNG